VHRDPVAATSFTVVGTQTRPDRALQQRRPRPLLPRTVNAYGRGMKRVLVGLVITLVGCGKREPEDRPAKAPPVRVAPPAEPAARCDSPGGHVCAGDDVIECSADGTPGVTVQSCKTGCKRGSCIDSCETKGVELIYLVDTDHNLSSFDPTKLPGDPFHLVGKLTCDPSSSPFSMAVDRHGVAWVLYENGRVFRVSIIDGHCSSSGVTPADAPRTFGMGFVSDGPTATTEKLFVAANEDSKELATLDTALATPRWTPVGTIKAKQTRNPELTGTGEGKLFGYFPEAPRGFVQELDGASGKAVGSRFTLGPTSGTVHAYAFAHWGGVFYIFATDDDGSAVHAIHRKNGTYELVLKDLPQHIVGAGVSTCAPQLERAPD
jgi:hypothetical protein